MKRLLPIILLILSIILGILFLVFVLRMIWFTPGSMGMMMGPGMMYHHMSFWFGQMLWILLIIIGNLMFAYLIIRKKRRDHKSK